MGWREKSDSGAFGEADFEQVMPLHLHHSNFVLKNGSHYTIVQDFRYIVVDGRVVVIGMPETTGEKEATRKGYRIPSEGLAAVLTEYFSRCWEENIGHQDYVNQVIKESGASLKVLAQELQISEDELVKISSGEV